MKVRNSLFLLIIFSLFAHIIIGQISFEQSMSINESGANPHGSAILDLSSTEKGLLIPRMTSTQRSAITGTEGLMVFDTTSDSFWYHDGSAWKEVGSGAFEIVNNVVRSVGNNSVDDFVFGMDELPPIGQEISENLFFFDKSKGAFRAGELIGSQNWESDSLGRSSLGVGLNVRARGEFSSAFGNSTSSLGRNSTAMGEGTQSLADNSLVIGRYNEINPSEFAHPASFSLFSVGNGISENFRSTAFSINQDGLIIGNGPGILYTSGSGSASTPERNSLNGFGKKQEKSELPDSLAIFRVLTSLRTSPGGSSIHGSLRSGISVPMLSNPSLSRPPGVGSLSSGINSLSFGEASSSLGVGILSYGYSGTVVGQYNDTLVIEPELEVTSESPLFIVGNGDDINNRSNALVVRKSGQIEIGSTSIKDTFNLSTNEAIFRIGANVTADADNVYNCGGSNFRWSKIFATNGTIQTSDMRAKKNISTINYGLKEIINLKPVIYNWKTDDDRTQKSLGLIAQDLKEIIPEVVNEPESKEDLLGVNYSELIPVLIKGIQEQQDLINELQLQVSTLEQKINKD